MIRRRLPQRRASETFNLVFRNQPITVSIWRYPGGDRGEAFISVGKSGTDIAAIAHDAAVVISLALQHGAPLEAIKRAITRDGNGAPSSILGAVIDALAATTRGAA